MIRNIQRTWFEVWGTEEAQNRFLKAILVFFVTLSCTQSVALVVLALRKPPIFAVSSTESRILTVMPPKPELLEAEVRRAVMGYVSARYTWDWQKIEETFNTAAKYISPDFRKKFLAANQDQIRIAREKKISQRFYIADTRADLAAKTVRIGGDRILLVEGLRATNPLLIEVQFDYGARTEINPEGIYIVGEKVSAADTNTGSNQ
ncbi:MAG: hypothetical protein HY074_16950 [Deltaproteobacteria bacterium]|nr:hypothetical protein [Deltaproteobacteria bacterium]